MVKDLQDAISHAKEVVELNRENAKYWNKVKNTGVFTDENVNHLLNMCEECAAEHEQLAAWLEQLLAIKLLYEEYKEYGGGFHYQVRRVFDGDYVLDNLYKETCSNCGWCQTSDNPEEEDTLVCANGDCENCGRVLGTLEEGPIDVEDCSGFEEPL